MQLEWKSEKQLLFSFEQFNNLWEYSVIELSSHFLYTAYIKGSSFQELISRLKWKVPL